MFVAVTSTTSFCTAGGRGVLVLDLDRAGAFSASCAAAFPGTVLALAAGDFDGDGTEDFAYQLTGVTNRVYFRMGGGATPWATAREVLVTPAPWRVDRLPGGVAQRMVALRPDGQAASDLVVVALDAPYSADSSTDYRTGLAVFRGGPGGPTLQQVGLLQPGATGRRSTSSASPPSAWDRAADGGSPVDGTDGTALLLDYPFTSNPPAPSPLSPAARAFRVGCMVGGDLDGDGIEDLVVLPRDAGPQADVLSGEGDGSFGRRPRFASRTGSRPAGDADGDGFADFAGPSPAGALEVLFHSDGGIATGPETPVAGQLFGAELGDWDGDGVPDAMARVGPTGFSFFRGVPGAPGRFDPPAAVTVVDASGALYPITTVFFRQANLGGPRPGIFAVLREGSQLHHTAIFFQDATHAEIGRAAPTVGSSDWISTDLDGDGVDDLVTVQTAVFAALVKPQDDPAASPTWPFRPWTQVAASAAFTTPLLAGAIPVPAAIPARSRAFVLLSAGLLVVDGAGGTPAAFITALPAGLLDQAWGAAIGDVTGDGSPDLVVSRTPPLPWLVFPGTPDGLVSGTPRADLSFLPGVASTFSTVPGTSGAADLVVDVPGGLLVLRNDGLGHFR